VIFSLHMVILTDKKVNSFFTFYKKENSFQFKTSFSSPLKGTFSPKKGLLSVPHTKIQRSLEQHRWFMLD